MYAIISGGIGGSAPFPVAMLVVLSLRYPMPPSKYAPYTGRPPTLWVWGQGSDGDYGGGCVVVVVVVVMMVVLVVVVVVMMVVVLVVVVVVMMVVLVVVVVVMMVVLVVVVVVVTVVRIVASFDGDTSLKPKGNADERPTSGQGSRALPRGCCA
jgi:hypothetical protein